MASLPRKLSQLIHFLRRRFSRRKRNRRQEFIRAVRGGMFRRLEPRRVLSVNASLNAGVLDISILSNDANTTATLQQASPTEFFVDANGDRTYDDGSDINKPAELRGLLADLHQNNVVGDGGNGTAFFWRDKFSSGILNSHTSSGNAV